MGVSTSLAASPGATEHLYYMDIEGGVRNRPVWDIAFVAATDGTATRWFSMTNERARKMILRSLPESWRTAVCQHGEAVQRVCYDADRNIINHTVCTGTMTDEVGAFLRVKRYTGGMILAAWGMDTHDAKVLRRLLGDEALDKESRVVLVDALKRVRAAWHLPKYTLGSEAPGTPRHVFDAGKYPGPSHTAYKDALCLRDVVQNSIAQLPSIPDTPSEIEFLAMTDEIKEDLQHGWWRVHRSKPLKVKELGSPERNMGADRPSSAHIAEFAEQPRWWSLKTQGRLTEDKKLRREFKRRARSIMGEDWSSRHGPALNRAMSRHAVLQVLARS